MGVFFYQKMVDSDHLFVVRCDALLSRYSNEYIFGAVYVQCLCDKNIKKKNKNKKLFEVNLFEVRDKNE